MARCLVIFGYTWMSLLLLTVVGALPSFAATFSSTLSSKVVHTGPIVTQINQVAGEPLTGVKGILHSQSGFIWLATNEGLVRFDGQSVKRFVHQADNANSLPANDVRAMVEDEQGIIWLITRGGGLSRFSPQTEQFTNFLPNGQASSIDSVNLNSLSLGQNNQLWIASDKGINRFDRQTYTNTRLNTQMKPRGFDEDESEQENVQLIFTDDRERVWFTVRRKGLFLYIPQGSQRLHFTPNSGDNNSLDSNVISDIYQSPNGDIWIGSALSVSRFNNQTLTFSRYTIPLKARNKVNHASVTSMAADKWGNLWVGTFYNGVSVLYQGGEHFVDIAANAMVKDSLEAMQINDVIQDLQGALWLVTARDGLIKVAVEHSLFDHHVATGHISSSINVRQQHYQGGLVMANNGQVLLLQDGQLWRYDSSLHQFTMFDHQRQIVDIVMSRQYGVLVAMKSGGIKRLDLNTDKLVEVFTNIDVKVAQFVIDDNDKYLWFYPDASDEEVVSGLFRYDFATGQLDSYFDDEQLVKQVSAFAASSSQFYVAFNDNQIYAFDYNQQKFRQLPASGSLVNQAINQIVVQDDGIWLATGNGIYHNSDESRPWTSLYKSGGEVYAITAAQANFWWASTSQGIVRVHRQTGQVTPIGKERGLRLLNFTAKAPVNMPSGDVLMAGFNDKLPMIVRFNPKRLAQNLAGEHQAQDILFTELKLFNQTVGLKFSDVNSPLSTTINQTEHLHLSHQQNWFTVLFTSQLFTSQLSPNDDVRYAYMLEGLSDQWIETTIGEAKFTSVSAGDYLFKVKVLNDEALTEQVRILPITVYPAWWNSNWAYALYFLLAFGFVLTIYGLRTQQLKQRAMVLEQKVDDRTKELKQRADEISLLLSEKEGLLDDKERLLEDKDKLIANISHEFRTPLTLILGPLGEQIAKAKDAKTTSQLSLAEANANRLLYMVDQLLDLARLKNPKSDQMKAHDLAPILQFLVGSFEPLAKARGMDLSIHFAQKQPIWVMAQADALEKVITNLLSNAIKYSDDGAIIEVCVKVLESQVQFSVKDNGFGISEDDLAGVFERFSRVKNDGHYTPGSGIGLALVKELLVIHQGDICVESQLGKGSCFTVTLPVLADFNQGDGQDNNNVVNEQVVVDAIARIEPRLDNVGSNDVLQHSESSSIDGRNNILVIEDNADMRQYIIDSLSHRFDCTAAFDGKHGLELAQQNLPDLVISDVMMPNMDGFEVTYQLKNDERTNHIPVILLTARGDRQSRIKGWSQKADEYLEKPFNTQELLMRIDNLLAIRQLLSKRFGRAFIAPESVQVETTSAQVEAMQSEIEAVQLEIEVEKEQSTDLAREDGANLNPAHQLFLTQTNKVLEQYYQDSDFDVAKFAVQMALSHRQLGRKMKAILDMTPAEALRNYRLNQGAKLLKQGNSASVVAHQVGFTTHSYFSQCFKARFNCLPSQFCHKD